MIEVSNGNSKLALEILENVSLKPFRQLSRVDLIALSKQCLAWTIRIGAYPNFMAPEYLQNSITIYCSVRICGHLRGGWQCHVLYLHVHVMDGKLRELGRQCSLGLKCML